MGGENIRYDKLRAYEPPPIIYINYEDDIPVDVDVIGSEVYRTPYETVLNGTGVCRNFAILTAGLLLAMDYSPVYILDIIYENSSEIGHTVAAVKINGEYFVLDQLPPIFSLWSYIKYQAEEEGTPIYNITVYEISKGDEFAGVKEVGVINATEIELECSATEESNKGGLGCYKVSNNDMKTIVSDLRKIIDDNTRLNWGYSLSDEYLPRKFESGVIWYLRYPEYWYHPAVHREFARYIFWEITNSKDI